MSFLEKSQPVESSELSEKQFPLSEADTQKVPNRSKTEMTPDQAIAALVASLDSASLAKLLKSLPSATSTGLGGKSTETKKRTYPRPEPDYVLQTVSFCSMCDSIRETNIQMTWDSENRLFKASRGPLVLARNTIRKLRKEPVASCPDCYARLASLSNEALIEKLLRSNESLELAMLLALKTKEIETTERPAIQLVLNFNN